jgi:hypothetical protein
MVFHIRNLETEAVAQKVAALNNIEAAHPAHGN